MPLTIDSHVGTFPWLAVVATIRIMRSPSAPIGVFDSGLGGLSVVHELWRELPRESILYVADSANCPYGERSIDFIRARSLEICEALAGRCVKAIVVACNTATAGALDLLRERIALPIIGLEPAVKPAMALTVAGKVAVLSTPVTAASPRLADLLDRYGVGLDIRSIGMPGLADRVEAGEGDSDEVSQQLRDVIEPLVADGVDTIVLGCTHYPFLVEVVRAIAGDEVRIVDSSNAIARRVRDVLISAHDLAPPPRLGASRWRRAVTPSWSAPSPAACSGPGGGVAVRGADHAETG
jgi:glutamate racemase